MRAVTSNVKSPLRRQSCLWVAGVFDDQVVKGGLMPSTNSSRFAGDGFVPTEYVAAIKGPALMPERQAREDNIKATGGVDGRLLKVRSRTPRLWPTNFELRPSYSQYWLLDVKDARRREDGQGVQPFELGAASVGFFKGEINRAQQKVHLDTMEDTARWALLQVHKVLLALRLETNVVVHRVVNLPMVVEHVARSASHGRGVFTASLNAFCFQQIFAARQNAFVVSPVSTCEPEHSDGLVLFGPGMAQGGSRAVMLDSLPKASITVRPSTDGRPRTSSEKLVST